MNKYKQMIFDNNGEIIFEFDEFLKILDKIKEKYDVFLIINNYEV